MVKAERSDEITRIIKEVLNAYRGLRKYLLVSTNKHGKLHLANYQQIKGAALIVEHFLKIKKFHNILSLDFLKEEVYAQDNKIENLAASNERQDYKLDQTGSSRDSNSS